MRLTDSSLMVTEWTTCIPGLAEEQSLSRDPQEGVRTPGVTGCVQGEEVTEAEARPEVCAARGIMLSAIEVPESTLSVANLDGTVWKGWGRGALLTETTVWSDSAKMPLTLPWGGEGDRRIKETSGGASSAGKALSTAVSETPEGGRTHATLRTSGSEVGRLTEPLRMAVLRWWID